MADLTITESQVVPATSNLTKYKSASALAVGDVVYESSAGIVTKADSSTAAKAAAKGLCVSSCSAANQHVVVQTGGSITLGAGAAPAAGQVYVVSSNAGKIAVESDVGSGAYVTILGVGSGSNAIKLNIYASAVAHV